MRSFAGAVWLLLALCLHLPARAENGVFLTFGPLVTWQTFPQAEPAPGYGVTLGAMGEAGGFEGTMVRSTHALEDLPGLVPGKSADCFTIHLGGKGYLPRMGAMRPYLYAASWMFAFAVTEPFVNPEIGGDLAPTGAGVAARVGTELPLAGWVVLDAGLTARHAFYMFEERGPAIHGELAERFKGAGFGANLGLTFQLGRTIRDR